MIGGSGQRVRIALARLQPDAQTDRPRDAPEPAVTVLASARSDVSDELDVRGRARRRRARRCARSSTTPRSPVSDRCASCTAAAPARSGRRCVTSSTGIRSSSRASGSADGATVAYLAARRPENPLEISRSSSYDVPVLVAQLAGLRGGGEGGGGV